MCIGKSTRVEGRDLILPVIMYVKQYQMWNSKTLKLLRSQFYYY